MNETKPLDQRIHDGARAREVLENDAFTSAFGMIEQELIEAWKTSPQRDAEGREKLFLALTMLQKVKAVLTTTVDTGKLALMELNHQNPTVRNQSRDYMGMS